LTLIEDYGRRGITFEIDGDKLRVTAPAGTLTAEDRARLAETKPSIMVELLRIEYAQRFRGQGPSPNEAKAINDAVERGGVCLTYCTALSDLVAFIKDDADWNRVPPGFVAYTIQEVASFFDMPIESIRLIHAAKRAGGGSVLPVDRGEDCHGNSASAG